MALTRERQRLVLVDGLIADRSQHGSRVSLGHGDRDRLGILVLAVAERKGDLIGADLGGAGGPSEGLAGEGGSRRQPGGGVEQRAAATGGTDGKCQDLANQSLLVSNRGKYRCVSPQRTVRSELVGSYIIGVIAVTANARHIVRAGHSDYVAEGHRQSGNLPEVRVANVNSGTAGAESEIVGYSSSIVHKLWVFPDKAVRTFTRRGANSVEEVVIRINLALPTSADGDRRLIEDVVPEDYALDKRCPTVGVQFKTFQSYPSDGIRVNVQVLDDGTGLPGINEDRRSALVRTGARVVLVRVEDVPVNLYVFHVAVGIVVEREVYQLGEIPNAVVPDNGIVERITAYAILMQVSLVLIKQGVELNKPCAAASLNSILGIMVDIVRSGGKSASPHPYSTLAIIVDFVVLDEQVISARRAAASIDSISRIIVDETIDDRDARHGRFVVGFDVDGLVPSVTLDLEPFDPDVVMRVKIHAYMSYVLAIDDHAASSFRTSVFALTFAARIRLEYNGIPRAPELAGQSVSR